jgi:hypothetical protein
MKNKNKQQRKKERKKQQPRMLKMFEADIKV